MGIQVHRGKWLGVWFWRICERHGERTSGAEKTKMSKSVKARKFENFGVMSKYYIATVYRE